MLLFLAHPRTQCGFSGRYILSSFGLEDHPQVGQAATFFGEGVSTTEGVRRRVDMRLIEVIRQRPGIDS